MSLVENFQFFSGWSSRSRKRLFCSPLETWRKNLRMTYEPLTTALYISGDQYLESDAVFGSRESLVVGYERSGNVDSINFDFVLASRAR